MDKTVLVIGSVTYAIKARRVLSRAGIQSKVIKTDVTDKNSSCTHGIEITANDLYSAVVALKNAGISYSLL